MKIFLQRYGSGLGMLGTSIVLSFFLYNLVFYDHVAWWICTGVGGLMLVTASLFWLPKEEDYGKFSAWVHFLHAWIFGVMIFIATSIYCCIMLLHSPLYIAICIFGNIFYTGVIYFLGFIMQSEPRH